MSRPKVARTKRLINDSRILCGRGVEMWWNQDAAGTPAQFYFIVADLVDLSWNACGTPQIHVQFACVATSASSEVS